MVCTIRTWYEFLPYAYSTCHTSTVYTFLLSFLYLLSCNIIMADELMHAYINKSQNSVRYINFASEHEP